MVRITRERRVDLAILVVYLLSLVVFAGYIHHQDVNRTKQNCLAIENLKAGQREKAEATIAGDEAFLKAHPGGTPDFPEAVVNADIAANQKVIDRYPPRDCGVKQKEGK